jgi:hypothetical protein
MTGRKWNPTVGTAFAPRGPARRPDLLDQLLRPREVEPCEDLSVLPVAPCGGGRGEVEVRDGAGRRYAAEDLRVVRRRGPGEPQGGPRRRRRRTRRPAPPWLRARERWRSVGGDGEAEESADSRNPQRSTGSALLWSGRFK